jgi:hypothetical protein
MVVGADCLRIITSYVSLALLFPSLQKHPASWAWFGPKAWSHRSLAKSKRHTFLFPHLSPILRQASIGFPSHAGGSNNPLVSVTDQF